MSWPKITLLVIFAIEALYYVSQIGEPRKPITPSDAVTTLITWGVIAWLNA